MSRSSPAQYRMRQAQNLCQDLLQRLSLELSLDTPRRHIDALVMSIEYVIEDTGGTLLTTDMRTELAKAKREIARRNGSSLLQKWKVLS